MTVDVPPWLDWMLVCLMWACGLLLGYVGALRLNHARGLYLAALRMVSIGWLVFAGRLTFILLTIGDLPLSWWAAGPLTMLALGSVVVSWERVQLGGRWRKTTRSSPQ